MAVLPDQTFEQGDEIVFLHRRIETVIDPDTKAERQIQHDKVIGSVRFPERAVIRGSGGTCEPEYVADDNNEQRDRRFLVLRLPMRY